MTIVWNESAVYAALAGGSLIGLAAALLVLLNGHVAGISGILGGLLHRKTEDYGWRLAFIAGLMVAPLVWSAFIPLSDVEISSSTITLICAGVLVGWGSRLGSGCTSGHGVCGLARFSLRSLVATGCFMGAAMITTFLMRHIF